MTAPTNWPDPNRPGVPMFPERDGWHVLENKRRKSLKLVFWDHQQEHYCTKIGYLTPLEIVSMDWGYYAPALTPAQINEMLAAERKRIGRAAFGNGYLIACCNIHNMHNEPSIAADILSQADITISEVMAMDLSEYDASALEEIRAARSNDPILKDPEA
ncbi:hypothetical protein [Acetobacter oryzifermentans]|uniref:Phage protein n=1 Tax=Acetobacter oryzifermentans TaxID=1633874 RepID=A0ABN4NLU2_9PROT|nr:hypothetical protein [Acetobacter oryzifermentans]ANA12888.1 hypothetical protein WG31_01695 [Acetobacter oryzifermentans]